MKLYSQRILSLASEIPHIGTLSDPDGRAKRRSPLCGSTVSVDIRVRDGKVTQFAQDVKACALGQAAASVIGQNVLGVTRETLETGREQLLAMLKEDGAPPKAPFDGLEVLAPARDYKNRHASIMLTFDALLAALDESEKAESH